MIVGRRYVRGLGQSSIISSVAAAGVTIGLPQNSSLTTLVRSTASYSPVHMLSALQRYQAQLQASPPATTTQVFTGPTQSAAPTWQGMRSLVDAAGQANVPDINAPTMDQSSAPMPLPAGPSTVAQTITDDGSGKLVIPANPYAASKPSSFSHFMWSWGPPVVAVTGLLAAIFFLTRKRKGT